MSKQQPIHEIRIGRIKAAIWQNETDNAIFYSVKPARLYKNSESWKTTDSFGRDDLPVLKEVLDRVYTYLLDAASQE